MLHLLALLVAPAAPLQDTASPPVAEAQAQQDDLAARLSRFEQRLAERLVDAHVPGAALAVVVDDEVVLVRGFGLADLEAERPVTAETLFAIGSATKAFTATTLAQLVDEGLLAWDDPVTRFLPTFELPIDAGDLAPEEAVVTLRDLLCHRTGFTRMGILWAGGGADRETILGTATQAEPWAPFRQGFHYNNVMYLAAGEVAARAAGVDSWDALVAERLLEPLGMAASTTHDAVAREREELALGYRWNDEAEALERDPLRNIDAVAPAGAIYSNARDMAQWLRLQLGDGELDGTRLVSEAALEETRTEQIELAPGVGYGLGWFVEQWQGHRVIQHGGNIDGFSSMVALVPAEELGFVLLTNVGASALQNGSRALFLESLLPSAEPIEAAAGDEAGGEADHADLVGTYIANYAQFEDEEFEVLVRDGKLAIDIPSQMVFELLPADEDGRYPFVILPEVIQASFVVREDGPATHLLLYQNGLTFEVPRQGHVREPDCTAAEFSHLYGSYEHPELPEPILVEHRDGRVVCDIPGQMAFDLRLPDDAGVWRFRATDELGLEFHLDEAGRATGLTFYERGTETECTLLEATTLDLPTVEEVLALRDAEAVGGRLRALGTVRWRGTTRLVHAGVEGKSTVTATPAGAFRSEDDFGVFGQSVTAFDGERGWTDSSFDVYDEPKGRYLEQLKLSNPQAFFGDWRLWFDEVQVVRRVTVEGAERIELELVKEGLPSWTVQVDAENGDVVQVTTRTLVPGIGSFPQTLRLSDHHEVGGVRMPFTIVTENDQSGRIEVHFEDVEVGLELPAEHFSKR